MKTLNKILVLLAIALWSSCSEKEIDNSLLVERNGIMYEVNSDDPYTGITFLKYENQQFKLKGRYKDGLKTGLWEFFAENGQYQSSSEYKNGKMYGIHKEYNSKGVLILEEEYVKGIKHGKHNKFAVTGNLEVKGVYINGEESGEWIFYRTDKSIVAKRNYLNGLLDGDFTMYFHNGKVETQGTYRKDKEEGLWIGYFKDGKKRTETNYSKGKLKGNSKEWNKTGQLIFEGTYPGLCTWYKKDGSKVVQGYFYGLNKYDESSFKFWVGDNKMIDRKYFTKYLWADSRYYKKGNYYRSSSEGYFYYKFFDNGDYTHYYQYRDGRSAWLGNNDKGEWRIAYYEFPKFAIELTSKTKGEIRSVEIFGFSNDGLSTEKGNWKKLARNWKP